MGIFRETLVEGTEGALGPEQPRVYSDLSHKDKDRYNADIQATNILLQRTSSNPRNQATVQDGRVVVQNVQGRQNRGQGNNAWGAGGPQETNGNTGLKKNVDAGQTEEVNVSTQQYIVFPLWSSISSSYKSSDDKVEDDTVDDNACKKTVQEPASEYDQALKNVLDKMIDQEKEDTKQSDAVRKEFEAQCNNKENITRVSSTNSFNTVSTPVNTASASRTFIPQVDHHLFLLVDLFLLMLLIFLMIL
ncbi:hypothetical protein Tco_0520895 [Tanacetum coccineum]